MQPRGQSCPISADRDVLQPSIGDYVEYNCPTCGRFRISGTAFELVSEHDPETLKTALNVAKLSADPGQVPMIKNLTGD